MQSVEITEFFYLSDFTWNQSWLMQRCKICHFLTFIGFEFLFSRIFALLGGRNLPNQPNSKMECYDSKSFCSSRSSLDLLQKVRAEKSICMPSFRALLSIGCFKPLDHSFWPYLYACAKSALYPMFARNKKEKLGNVTFVLGTCS